MSLIIVAILAVLLVVAAWKFAGIADPIAQELPEGLQEASDDAAFGMQGLARNAEQVKQDFRELKRLRDDPS